MEMPIVVVDHQLINSARGNLAIKQRLFGGLIERILPTYGNGDLLIQLYILT